MLFLEGNSPVLGPDWGTYPSPLTLLLENILGPVAMRYPPPPPREPINKVKTLSSLVLRTRAVIILLSGTPFAELHFRYAILFAQRGANLDLPGEILNNNYILLDIERIINCTLQRLDLEVLNFNLSNGDAFSRGQGMEFILRTEVIFIITFRGFVTEPETSTGCGD